ncbi:ATP-binding protein [Leptospira sp. 'Mane']|uniref:ATP-binding protein n=1 Tax=Leptospira sp. 'Mane' TaxID=3387407 RepID=UPI00398AD784
MKIKPKQAASLFFPNTSLEFVYFEAVANSIDAGASNIDIIINIDNFNEPKTLTIQITDNGEGFTDRNFEKFNNVLDVEDDQHKGVGRLVFLKYFETIEIKSELKKMTRLFTFNEKFDGECNIKKIQNKENKTTLLLKNYRLEKIRSYQYITSHKIQDSLLTHFLPKFYQMKFDKKNLKININLNTKEENPKFDFYSNTTSIEINQLPNLKEKSLADPSSFFQKFKLLYSVERSTEQSVISAVCADGRTIPIELISNKEFPTGFKMVFILYSDFLNGKTNTNRESFLLDDKNISHLKKIFIKMVSQVIKEEIPEISEVNRKTTEILQNQYPHLVGYFDDDSLGLAEKSSLVTEAQEKFFNDQREILESVDLSDNQFEKSLNFSARILTEYILYRTKILSKLKSIDKNSNESEIHDLIAPRKKIYSSNKLIDEYFTNNAWVLDDKYMTYSKLLSDIEIKTIYKELNVTGSNNFSDNESGRPDITIIFSGDPNISEKVDVVIIEFKKINLKLSSKEEVVSQLRQRARRLIEYYPSKIQRIWFYGIVDFDPEFKVSLIESGFTQLFSTGDLYYKSQEIIIDSNTMEKRLADLFILSYNSMLDDAESRNATFLNILKDSIRESVSKL